MRTTRGFSVIELMVTVALAAILLATAVPSLSDLLRRNKVAAATNELVGALQLARAEAVRRGRPVSICRSLDNASCVSGGDWSQGGWMVFQDAASTGTPVTSGPGFELVRVFPGLDAGFSLGAPGGYLRFRANGSVQPFTVGASEESFGLQPETCTGNMRREIAISRLGRVRSSEEACT